MGIDNERLSLATFVVVGVFVLTGCSVDENRGIERERAADSALDDDDTPICSADMHCFAGQARCVGTNQIENMVSVDCHHACGPGPCEGGSCIPSGFVRDCPTGTVCEVVQITQYTKNAVCLDPSSGYGYMDAGDGRTRDDRSQDDGAVDASAVIDGSTKGDCGESVDDCGQDDYPNSAGSDDSCLPVLNRDEAVYIFDIGCPEPSLTSPSGYLPTDLGILGETFAVPLAINNCGAVVGQGGESKTKAVLSIQGHLWDLGSLGGSTGVAEDINDNGVIVGFSEDEQSTDRPFIWKNGVMSALSGIVSGYAYAINDHDQVVGVYRDQSGYNGFLWDNGTVTPISRPLNSTSITPRAINNLGQVVGDVNMGTLGYQAFFWENGFTTLLPSLAGSDTSATDINDLGDIVGSSDVSGRPHAVLWKDGVIQDLFETLPDTSKGDASALNNDGVIVGYVDDVGMSDKAYVFAEGEIKILEGVIAEGPFRTSWANDINDRGEILGVGVPSYDRTVVWSKTCFGLCCSR